MDVTGAALTQLARCLITFEIRLREPVAMSCIRRGLEENSADWRRPETRQASPDSDVERVRHSSSVDVEGAGIPGVSGARRPIRMLSRKRSGAGSSRSG